MQAPAQPSLVGPPQDRGTVETVDTVDDDTLGFRTIRKLNLTNPNYFDLTAS